jgi:hypothetical protein
VILFTDAEESLKQSCAAEQEASPTAQKQKVVDAETSYFIVSHQHLYEGLVFAKWG